MTPAADWPEALATAASARVVLLLGETDSGKTSLVTWLAARLAERGFPAGVVDADLGQSRIGPPATVGLGRVTGPIESLSEAEPLALAWVGSISPPGFETVLWEATRRLVLRAASSGLRPILVDTCGLVEGPLGNRVKLGKIRHVEPDLVICLRRATECDRILAELARSSCRVMTLPVSESTRRRSSEERRRHREAALEAYFAGARLREVPLDATVPGVGRGPDGLPDTVVGLLDEWGETLGLGRIASVDLNGRRLWLETPVTARDIARVAIGSEKLSGAVIHEVIQ